MSATAKRASLSPSPGPGRNKELDPETGEENEVPVMKDYTVFNVAERDSLPRRC